MLYHNISYYNVISWYGIICAVIHKRKMNKKKKKKKRKILQKIMDPKNDVIKHFLHYKCDLKETKCFHIQL